MNAAYKALFAKAIMPISMLMIAIAPSYSFAGEYQHHHIKHHKVHHDMHHHKKSNKVPNMGKPWSNPAKPKKQSYNTPVQRPILETEDACHAKELQYLVGQNKSVLSAMKFGQVTRIGGPDTMFTMDYNPARLNILFGDNNIINSVKCG